MLIFSINTATLGARYNYHPQFIDGKTESYKKRQIIQERNGLILTSGVCYLADKSEISQLAVCRIFVDVFIGGWLGNEPQVSDGHRFKKWWGGNSKSETEWTKCVSEEYLDGIRGLQCCAFSAKNIRVSSKMKRNLKKINNENKTMFFKPCWRKYSWKHRWGNIAEGFKKQSGIFYQTAKILSTVHSEWFSYFFHNGNIWYGNMKFRMVISR